MTSLASFLAHDVVLPSLPAMVCRLTELSEDPRADLGEFAELVHEDPAMTARVLRLVNSPLFRFGGQVDSIRRAISLIGVRELHNLALAVSATRVFDGLPGHLVNMAQFWRHSLCCALVSRELALRLRERETERFFVAGLLHDVGALVLYSHVPEQALAAIEQAEAARRPLVEVERELLGFDHAELGGELLRRWRLPEHIVAAVEGHHGGGFFSREGRVVHLANQLVGAADARQPRLAPVETDEAAWDAIGLAPELGPLVLSRAAAHFEAARLALLAPRASWQRAV